MVTEWVSPPAGGRHGFDATTLARLVARALVALALLAAAPAALAQDGLDPPPILTPEMADPALNPNLRTVPNVSDPAGNLGIRSVPGAGMDPATGLPADPGLPAAAAPFAAPDAMPEGLPDLDLRLDTTTEPRLLLSARLTEDGGAVQSGLVWRVFSSQPDADGALPLVAEATGGDASFDLDPGVYLVYCGFGHAGTTVRVEARGGLAEEVVVLNAGGLLLRAAADESSRTLPSEDVRFDIYSLETDDRGERKVVARDVAPDELVRLAADTYHVVSRYGAVNAQTNGEVEVRAGKLTEVTLYQRAAEVTLKLVGSPGGEAIADTSWSILTPGGDIVTEGVGAFPSFVLAAGEYTVVARHDSRVFQRAFDVETGRDAEVEVIAAE